MLAPTLASCESKPGPEIVYVDRPGPVQIPDSLRDPCPAGAEETYGQARESYRNEVLCWRGKWRAAIGEAER